MKGKHFFIGILSLISIATYAQTEQIADNGEKTAVTDFSFKINQLDEFQQTDWDFVREIFKDNAPEQEITIAYAYENPSDDKSIVKIENFKIKLTGKTADLEKMIESIQNQFLSIASVD